MARIGVVGKLVVFCVVALFAGSASAQDPWSMVIPACQERLTDGVDDNVTLSSSTTEGGNRATVGGTSTGYRYFWCPVYVPNGTTFNIIEIRYKDNVATAGNDAWAGFYRQPWTSGSGNAVSLGSVTSTDSANVPNVVTGGFTTVTIDNANQTYWVFVRVGRTSTSNDIRAYQVRLRYNITLSSTEPTQEALDCGDVVAKPEWAITNEERERCLLDVKQ